MSEMEVETKLFKAFEQTVNYFITDNVLVLKGSANSCLARFEAQYHG